MKKQFDEPSLLTFGIKVDIISTSVDGTISIPLGGHPDGPCDDETCSKCYDVDDSRQAPVRFRN